VPSAPEGASPASGGGSMFGTMSTFLIFLLPLALIFFMSRGQNKKQKALESSLKAGDRVITRAGAIGKVIDVGPRVVKVELAPGVNVQFLKTAIEGLDTDDTKKADDAKKTDDKEKKDDK
jgi:preprotein translocase subunit YajC